MKKIILFALFTFCFHSSFCDEIEKLVILGSGPAGLTSSLFAAQANLNPLVIQGDQYDGQITSIYRIENYPGFPEGISGEELAARIRAQAEIFGARFNPSYAVAADLLHPPFTILLGNGDTILCEALIIATGASPRWLGLEGEASLIGYGISSNAVADREKYAGREVFVVGGGDSAMEQALLLAEYASSVTVVYKNSKFFAAPYLQERVLNNPKIACLFNSEIAEVVGAEQKDLTGVVVHNLISGEKRDVNCAALFVSNGRKPNTSFFANQLEMTEGGYIITKPDSTKTSIDGIFAAGDITHLGYKKVTTSVASGCMAAIDAIKFLNSTKKN